MQIEELPVVFCTDNNCKHIHKWGGENENEWKILKLQHIVNENNKHINLIDYQHVEFLTTVWNPSQPIVGILSWLTNNGNNKGKISVVQKKRNAHLRINKRRKNIARWRKCQNGILNYFCDNFKINENCFQQIQIKNKYWCGFKIRTAPGWALTTGSFLNTAVNFTWWLR